MKITAASLPGLKPKPGQRTTEYPDDAQRGLVISVSETNTSFAIRSSISGKKIRVPVGRFPEMSLATARKKASIMMGQIDQGVDPRGVTETVDAAWDVYWETRQTTLKHPNEDLSRWMRLIQPVMGHLKLGAIPGNLIDLLQDHWRKQGQGAGQVSLVRIVSHFSGWLEDRSMVPRRLLPRRIVLPKMGSHAVPSLEQTQSLWRWCVSHASADDPKAVHARIIGLIILTGARRDMISSLEWSEVDQVNGMLIFPAERMKAGRAFQQPLSQAALDWVAAFPRRLDSKFVFPVKTGKGPTSVNIGKYLAEAWYGAGNVIHGLRKAMATTLQDNGVLPHVIGLLLDHSPASVIGATTSIYAKGLYLPERRAALEQWSRLVKPPAPLALPAPVIPEMTAEEAWANAAAERAAREGDGEGPLMIAGPGSAE